MACLYKHIRLDTNKVFYIGIGKTKTRAYSIYNRNKYWNNIVNNTQYKVEIIKDNISWEKACELEIYFIKKYKRFFENGTLCNITQGGQGNKNPSKEVRNKISNSKKIKVKNIITNEIWDSLNSLCKDKNLSAQNMSRKLNGTRNNDTEYRYINYKKREYTTKNKGISNYHCSKKVKNIKTGKIYNSAKEASNMLNFKYSTLCAILNGQNKNNTNLIYI